MNPLSRRKDIELVWIKDEFSVIANMHLLPKIPCVVFAHHIEINYTCKFLRPVSDEIYVCVCIQIHAQNQAITKLYLSIDK